MMFTVSSESLPAILKMLRMQHSLRPVRIKARSGKRRHRWRLHRSDTNCLTGKVKGKKATSVPGNLDFIIILKLTNDYTLLVVHQGWRVTFQPTQTPKSEKKDCLPSAWILKLFS